MVLVASRNRSMTGAGVPLGANNPFQTRQAHELVGMIALEEKDYDKALSELQ